MHSGTEVRELRREAGALKEVVDDLTLENHAILAAGGPGLSAIHARELL